MINVCQFTLTLKFEGQLHRVKMHNNEPQFICKRNTSSLSVRKNVLHNE